ncbi:MAG: DUF805 domain-containing protein [Algibacter sp.]
MKWFQKVLIENYINFSGRARRQEYWMFVLIWLGIVILIGTLSSFIEEYSEFTGTSIIIGIFMLATLIPWIALNVRRLHDTGKSGGYLFIHFIPIVGRIWYIVLMASAGNDFSNKYGPDPKRPDSINEIDEIGKPVLED